MEIAELPFLVRGGNLKLVMKVATKISIHNEALISDELTYHRPSKCCISGRGLSDKKARDIMSIRFESTVAATSI